MSDMVPPQVGSNGNGLKSIEDSISWSIGYFNMLLMGEDSGMDDLRLEFSGTGSRGHSYLRTVFLRVHREDDAEAAAQSRRRSIRFHYELADRAPGDRYRIKLEAEGLDGQKLLIAESPIRDVSAVGEDSFPFNSPFLFMCEHLQLRVTFQLYYSRPTFEEFQLSFADKARNDLAGFNPGSLDSTNAERLTLVAADGGEFTIVHQILVLRSPVFASSLQHSSSTRKQMQLSSTSLTVLLTYICCGELLPEWSESRVLLQLTAAAGEYQLQELLAFLDVMMGSVCDLQNVVHLFTLSCKFSLNVARGELLKFMEEARKGVGVNDPLAINMGSLSLQ